MCNHYFFESREKVNHVKRSVDSEKRPDIVFDAYYLMDQTFKRSIFIAIIINIHTIITIQKVNLRVIAMSL